MLSEYLDYLNEGYLFSDKTISVNLDDFASGKKNNLLILGVSGAGKTTIGKKLADKYNAKLFKADEDFRSVSHIADTIKSNKRTIIEGIDLVVMYDNEKYRKLILNQSMIVMGKAALKGGIQAGIRNKKQGMSSKEILRLVKINFKWIEKPLKKLRKELQLKYGDKVKEFSLEK